MNVFLARQPIFDRDQNVVGYELLFRNGLNNSFPLVVEGYRATLDVISNSYLMGFESVSAGKRTFINFTQDLLSGEVPLILPKDRVVVEILEDVQPDQEVIDACKRLKKWGYMLALDDYSLTYPREAFLEVVDYVKVDFRVCSEQDRKAIVQRYGRPSLQFLAEKVETRAEFKQAVAAGYSLFQGYFFSEPEVLAYRNITANNDICLQVLDLLNQPEWDYVQLANIIKRDVSFSFKLLRYINSAAVGLPVRVKSIKQALVLLGKNQVKKFLLLNTLSRLAQDKPEILTAHSIFRARFAELLVKTMGLAEMSSEVYLMGLFSMIDTILERPMAEVLTDLPLRKAVKEALLGRVGLYRSVLDLVIAYEKGDWEITDCLLTQFELAAGMIPALYEEAIRWGDLSSGINR